MTRSMLHIHRGRRALLAVSLPLVLVLAACGGGEPRVEARFGSAEDSPTSAGASTAPASTATASRDAARPSATVTTAGPVPSPARNEARRAPFLPGQPLDSSHVDAALAAAGIDARGTSESVSCGGASTVAGSRYRVSGQIGSFLLLVYPSPAALGAAWFIAGSGSPVPVDASCGYPAGVVYWNNNLILVIDSVGTGLSERVADAFLGVQ